MPPIYVTGHRNPDTDSIAAAIGYAELKRRLEPGEEYVAVRLGELATQTRWVLERSGAPEPQLLPHVMLRACDVMQPSFPTISGDEPIRVAGMAMARAGLDLVPVLEQDGTLAGVVTERALARRYIRETRETSTLEEAPTDAQAIVEVLGGELVAGRPDARLAGRVWVHSMDVSSPSGISGGDVVVVGNRADAQRLAIGLGAALLVISNGSLPSEEVLALARAQGTAIVVSPLDSYVSGRMITLAAPCRAFMERDPLTVSTDYLLADVSEQIKEIHYGAAVAVDAQRHPVGLITRSDLVAPTRRRVLLVDHAEQSQSVPGVEQAEIVEILDHHHVGSIETRVPVTATFDPVGSTASLVVERFRQNGMEPSRPTAVMLLGAVLSDTVILNSPTTTERDRAVVDYLERVLATDAEEFGREMFESAADVSEVSAEEIIARDAKRYQVGGGQEICIAQIEVVGNGLLDRQDELLEAMRRTRARDRLALYALMVTDILSKGTHLLIAGDTPAIARSFGTSAHDGMIELPGVMSRKKQVAPRLLATM
ncbi:MAG: putative manganese-dependent inorganic diphosphatase [Solirubrobacterales bacterium]|nr:putative manganese-dependent inorganic diphosphatase [Solirubrobacterales bacterium]MBV9471602.1 putative manganese-dependent inorganic diphosphatase [Solirubrobacterales bacterium]